MMGALLSQLLSLSFSVSFFSPYSLLLSTFCFLTTSSPLSHRPSFSPAILRHPSLPLFLPFSPSTPPFSLSSFLHVSPLSWILQGVARWVTRILETQNLRMIQKERESRTETISERKIFFSSLTISYKSSFFVHHSFVPSPNLTFLHLSHSPFISLTLPSPLSLSPFLPFSPDF